MNEEYANVLKDAGYPQQLFAGDEFYGEKGKQGQSMTAVVPSPEHLAEWLENIKKSKHEEKAHDEESTGNAIGFNGKHEKERKTA